jgi:hypothetical protein
MSKLTNQRERDEKKGLCRYEVRCNVGDKKLIRFFADWTMDHRLTITELKKLLDSKNS